MIWFKRSQARVSKGTDFIYDEQGYWYDYPESGNSAWCN